MSILCLGPKSSGKTLLLQSLQNASNVDSTSTSVPTTGTNMYTIKHNGYFMEVRELGGSMAPLWHKYFGGVSIIVYVIDASNLCTISAAGVLLYTLLVNPALRHCKITLICISICMFVTLVASYPLPQDLEGAATGDDHYGRVQMKVFRGPTEHDGHHHFAPWGYWVKQPSDHDH